MNAVPQANLQYAGCGRMEIRMKALAEMLEKLEFECIKGNLEVSVTEIVYDSRMVTKGCLFVCIDGTRLDGHSFAKDAVSQGARVLLVSKEIDLEALADVTVIKVKDTRYAMALLSAAFFDYPARKLKVIGITGTKGKTTTAYLVKNILENAGFKTGLIGTIEIIIGDRSIPASHTTPESYMLQKYLREMTDAGCKAVVMEVSSQGLMMHRTQGIQFEIGVFTNLERDHIGEGEHSNMEEYMACKGKLFQQCNVGLVNRDDNHWETVLEGHTCDLETFGFSEEASLQATDAHLIERPGFLGVCFQVKGLMNFFAEVDTPGLFSVYNALAAIAVCGHLRIETDYIRKALRTTKVKGRIEMIPVSKEFTLMIDYAHNAMALESLLITLKEYQPRRLVCLFGCGGNRSKDRRYEMGEVSGRLADLTVITSDNPRFEEPQDIIDDIKSGIQKTEGNYIEISDRREAIAYVISQGQPGDVIVLAGKGHEDYQEIKGVKYPMDERVIIEEILQEA